jgi:hypothetical protein
MITKAQQEAVLAKYRQAPDGSPTYLHFRRRWRMGGMCGDMWLACHNWCGMYLGIEKDGYTHS